MTAAHLPAVRPVAGPSAASPRPSARAPGGSPGAPARWWLALAELVAPAVCSGCGVPSPEPMCLDCARMLEGWPVPGPSSAAAAAPALRAAAHYAGPVRRALLDYKEHGVTALAPLLGEALAGAVAAALHAAGAGCAGGRASRLGALQAAAGSQVDWPANPLGALLLVPAPSSARARRHRGHDPVGALAVQAAAVLSGAGVAARPAPVLRQLGRVRDQAGLGAAARARNLGGSLALRPGCQVRGTRVVLVDDIVTTGATLVEAARVLRGAGATVAAAATVAATPRRR